ncbi:MAG: thiamine pyrophosphate-dependent enzyme, partial [Bilophila wadsworthia]
MQPKGALIYYIASDFTPSSTQHVIDPRYLFKSCFVPVFEPRKHQEMLEAAGLAADISRTHRTPVVIFAGGLLCHSEGLVKLAEQHTRPLAEVGPLALQYALPGMARISYDTVMAERMPGLVRMVEESPLNIHYKGAGRRGVITCGATTLLMREYKERFDPDLDILSVAFTNPLPMERIRAFCASIKGEVSVIEDGYRFIQEACLAAGLDVSGKDALSPVTEWTPERIAAFLGRETKAGTPAPSVPRPPMICAGCPYRLAALHLGKLHKRGDIEAIFGDIGCNTLIKGLNALDVNLCMGASEAMRMGYVLSKPEAAARCVSIIGDGTECHSGMDATRNTVFRQVPGLKIVLDNEWIAMTGGQPSPSSPCNLAGQPNAFRLDEALKSQGAHVITADAYDKAEIEARVEEGPYCWPPKPFAILIIGNMHPQSPGLGLRASSPWTRAPQVRTLPHLPRHRGLRRRHAPLEQPLFRLRVPHARLSPDVPVQGPFRRGLQHGNGSRNCHASPCSRGHRRSSRRFLPASSPPVPRHPRRGRAGEPVLRQGAGASGLPRRVRRPQHPQR